MKILFATNGLASSIHALKEGIRLLPLATSEVIVVAVLDPEARIGGNENASDDLTEAMALFAQAGVNARSIQLRGHPAEAIVEKAREEKVDIIVVGTKSHSKVGRLLVGSVSEDVIQRFDGAVLVIKARA